MLIARFFVKDTTISVDIPVSNGFVNLMTSVRTDGFLGTEAFFIPFDQIKCVLTYEGAAPANVLHLVPNPDKSS